MHKGALGPLKGERFDEIRMHSKIIMAKVLKWDKQLFIIKQAQLNQFLD